MDCTCRRCKTSAIPTKPVLDTPAMVMALQERMVLTRYAITEVHSQLMTIGPWPEIVNAQQHVLAAQSALERFEKECGL
jgi:hypothetical protein